ncbi:MAG: 50S ribosomal protein L4 [Spirochaetaceae bacterium]|nr:50S ribosomal protein L4 [Spirochaetaceae bacterium]
MTVPVIGAGGGARGEAEVADGVFGVEVSEGAIYHAIRNELANRRVGTASTKSRSQVRGTSRKPWRQKGTGRARAGDVKSPLWTGGGVIFGPQPRSYRYRLPRKAKRTAMRSILTQKARERRITIVDGVAADSGKTRELVRQLEPITGGVRCLWLLDKPAPMLVRAARNIPWLRMGACDTVTAHDLYYSERILLTPAAAERFAQLLGERQGSGAGQVGAGGEEA